MLFFHYAITINWHPSRLRAINDIMKSICFIAVISISFFACRKDPKTEYSALEAPPQFHLVTTPGSWWKYESYTVDSMGVETLNPEIDCVYVVGDTMINGEVYSHLQGTYFGAFTLNTIRRDSSHYIINSFGGRLFSTVEQIETLKVSEGFIENIYCTTNGMKEPKMVPAGIFEVYDSEVHHWNADGSPYTNCEMSWTGHEYFADGIGMIALQSGYISQIQNLCEYQEMRLIEYYIAP